MPTNKPANVIDIGISEADRKAIADGLSRVLADSYMLYLKTHNYHWNVKGPMFNTLHLMFEQQYNELALPGFLRELRQTDCDPGRRRGAGSRGHDYELVGRA